MAVTTVTTSLSSNAYAVLTSGGYHGERQIDMHDTLFKSYPQLAPLLAIFTKLGSDETQQSRIDWMEDEELPDTIHLSAGSAASAAAINSNEYAYVRNHDVLYNLRTREIFVVDDTSIDATISVQPGWGDTDPAACLAGDILIKLTPSYPESSEDANPMQVVNTPFYNWTQEVALHTRHSKRTLNEATHFGGPGSKRDQDNAKMVRLARKQMEMNILLGTRADTLISGATGNTKTAGGITWRLYDGTNHYHVDGVLTETKLDYHLADLQASYPETTRFLAVGSPRVMTTLTHFAKPLIRTSPNSKDYGMMLDQYSGAVKLDLLPHPLMNRPYLREWLLILNVDYCTIKWQERLMLDLDVGVKQHRHVTDMLSGFFSFICASEARHSLLTGIKG